MKRGPITLLTLALLHAALVSAQDYPSKPVRVVAPFPPGSGADVVGRIYAPKFHESLGRQFVIDTRPGAAGSLAAKLVADATPDGYTLLVLVASIASGQPLYKDLAFDVARDFRPAGMLATGSYLLVVNANVAVQNLKDLIALARSKPGKLNDASTGTGGALHLTMEMLKLQAGIDMLHVPYKGSQTTVPDLIGGRVDTIFGSTPSLTVHVKSGRIRAIGISSLKRSPSIPEVPTIAESGLPSFESTSWFALVAPVKTPPAIVTRLHAAIQNAAQAPDVITALANQGSEPALMSQEQLRDFVRQEVVKWSKVVKEADVKLE